MAFAGAFTGKELKEFKHSNIAGDHVAGGIRHKGYPCKRNTGAFTWSHEDGARFFYQDYTEWLDKAAQDGGMGFAQEMMIREGKAVKTTRPLDNVNVFRALCQDANGDLALFETQGKMSFGNFIEALVSQGVTEALYTDMGQGWNYCFYRQNANESLPRYLHDKPLPYASNFVILRTR